MCLNCLTAITPLLDGGSLVPMYDSDTNYFPSNYKHLKCIAKQSFGISGMLGL